MRGLLILAIPVLLAGCGGNSEAEAGGVTADEARALDEAAEMIEQRRLPDDALAKPRPAPAISPAPDTGAPGR